MDLINLFILFIFSSFIGWIIETVFDSLNKKKVVNRGMLLEPLCPIYGFGTILTIILFSKQNNYLIIFLTCFIGGSLLEYFTSYLIEKVFGLRWWDYSAIKYNIHGRICLLYSMAFGVGGIVILLLYKYFFYVVNLVPFDIRLLFVTVEFLILLFDILVTVVLIKRIDYGELSFSGDSSDEVEKIIHNKIKRLIRK